MKYTKLFTAISIIGIVLSGCGSSSNTCCDTSIVIKKGVIIEKGSKSEEKPIPTAKPKDKNGEGDDNSTIYKNPIAIITPDIPYINAGDTVEFDCAKSYDQDEQGDEIIECKWHFKCIKEGKTVCECDKKSSHREKLAITPPYGAKSVEVTLTVIDDENQTDTVKRTIDIVSR